MKMGQWQRILSAAAVLGLAGCSALASETTEKPSEGVLVIEDGTAQPILTYSDINTPNADSEILRFCVYVETDHDTDGDGKADLVKAFIQVPKSAAEGKYKAAAIYDPMPHTAGVVSNMSALLEADYGEETLDTKWHTAKTGEYSDYTIVLTPTEYQLEEGHVLKLYIFAQDPARTREDDSQPGYVSMTKTDEVYSFKIDNASVEVSLPIRE